jgi:hypothetical protein
MFARSYVVLALILLPALYAARIDHQPMVFSRAPRGHGAAEGRGWPAFSVPAVVAAGWR